MISLITICGDIYPMEGSEELLASGDIDGAFGDALSLFRQSDRVIVNLECALTDSGTPPIRKKGPNMRASVKCAKALADAGVTDCALSNNHIFDYGIRGMRDTIRALEENGLLWTGLGENEDDARRDHIIEAGGKRIAVINVCEHEYSYALSDRPGARPYDPYDTMEDIRGAKKEADFVIVLYHGGKEYCEYPSPRLRKLCRAMAKNGADVVLCQHSHMIGCYEEFENCHILYGQGNFHFIRFAEFPGFAVQLDIGEKIGISFVPVVNAGSGIVLAKGEEKNEIMEGFQARSGELKGDGWLEGWRSFCEQHRTPYLNAVANAFTAASDEDQNQQFSHYLDCEAHTDVWRELFPTWNHTNEKGAL